MYFGILFKIVDTCKYIIILIIFRMIDRRKSNPEKLGGKRGVISVEIEKSIYQEIVKEAESKNISIRKFTNKLLRERFEKSEFLKLVAPKLSLLDFGDDSILIRDETATKDHLAVIKIRDGRLWCDLDEDYDCRHIHYVLTLPQLASIKDKLNQI